MNLAALQRDQLEIARTTLSSDVFDYLDAGAGAEVTRAESRTSWHRYRLRPRVLTDVAEIDLTTTVLGQHLATPVLVAPSAHHGLCHPDGEVATAVGVRAAGSRLTLSTRASVPFEDVGAAAGGPWWFQVYLTQDPAVWRGAVQRAAAAGATALVLTGDTPVLGRKPRLAATRVAAVDEYMYVNLGRHVPDGADPATAVEQSPRATVAAIGELRDLTGLPVLVKGVLRGDEAVRCLDAGASGVIVSNHGGRQLDRAVSSAQALPEVVAAVGGRAPVLVDGGLADGTDVLTALALGAAAVM
ncbi:MAG: alpha-hydroxy acid oxidase, partial [Actinomycetota bacterium]